MSYAPIIFEHLCNHLLSRREHLARLILGSACEQWFSAEAFVSLNFVNSPLPSGCYVVNESCKRDLTLFGPRDGKRVALATFEAKVVYPNKNFELSLARLQEQLVRPALRDETADTERMAIIYAVWLDEFGRRDLGSPSQFQAAVLGQLQALFPHETHCHFPRGELVTLVPESIIHWGSDSRRVWLGAACVACLPIHE